MSWGDKDRARIEELCRLLTPPTGLSSIGATPSQDDSRWVSIEVPHLLARLHEKAGQCPAQSDAGLEVWTFMFVAAARFLDARKPSTSVSAPRDAVLSGIKDDTKALAKSIVQRAAEQTKIVDLTEQILKNYIKPLFSATHTSSLRQETGRATSKPVGLVDDPRHRNPFTAEEDILWKGGGQTSKVQVLGRPAHFLESQGSSRNAAIGCCHVLGAACRSLVEGSSDPSSAWSTLWPLVLPPMLTLLEDASPHYRLLGARILSVSLLSSGAINESEGETRQRQRLAMASLLSRTGLSPLLFTALETSFAYAASSSDPFSAPLLEASSEAYIRLALILRDERDDQRARLYTVLDDAVLRIWAYNVNPTPSSKTSERGKESTDVLSTTMETIQQLCRSGVLGIAITPYLDVLLDFLSAQFNFSQRGALAIKTVTSLIEAGTVSAEIDKATETKVAPGLLRWREKLLAAVARAWTLNNDATDEERDGINELRRSCQLLVQALKRIDQDGTLHSQFDRLVKMDSDVFQTLVSPTSSP